MWLHLIDNVHMFLLRMSWSYELGYLQSAPIPHKKNMSLVHEVNGLTLGKFAQNSAATVGEDIGVNCLHPSIVQKDYPHVENPG